MLMMLLDCIRAVLVQITVGRGGGRRRLITLGFCTFVLIYCTEIMAMQLLQSFPLDPKLQSINVDHGINARRDLLS